eukprot:315743_1
MVSDIVQRFETCTFSLTFHIMLSIGKCFNKTCICKSVIFMNISFILWILISIILTHVPSTQSNKANTTRSTHKINIPSLHRGAWCIHDYLQISDQLLHHLQNTSYFMSMPQDKLTDNGFIRAIDYKEVPNHIYYEGYFHALHTSDAIPSLNPRFGKSMMKPAAPLSLRAFIILFKQLNKIWIKNAIQDTFIQKLNLSQNLFSDIAVQMHFGDEIDFSAGYTGFHKDFINSILHFSVSLRGKRSVYYVPNEDMKMVDNGNNRDKYTINSETKFLHQNEGNCYLGSLYAFYHGVVYPETSWNNRIIAIQCRLLLSLDEYMKIKQFSIYNELNNGMNHITEILHKSKIVVPTLEQVLQMEQNIIQNEINQQLSVQDTCSVSEFMSLM